MPKHTESEYTQKLKDIADSGFRFHSLPETEEQFWHDKKEVSRPIQIARELGHVATTAAGIVGDNIALAGTLAARASSKSSEKIWNGINRAATRLSDEGIEESVWNLAADTGERILYTTHRLYTHLGGAAVGAAIRRDVAEQTSSAYSPAPLYWGTLSKSAEMLQRGTDKIGAGLYSLSIDEDRKSSVLEPIKRKASDEAARHRRLSNHFSESADKRLDRLSEKSASITIPERYLSKNERKQSRQLAEIYRKKAAEAHASGRYSEATKYTKEARRHQEKLIKGRVATK